MRQTFQIFGIVVLLICSFIYKEEVNTASLLSDDLLNEIKEKSKDYKIKQTEAIIENDTIIPGKSGKKVNIKESYNKMSQIGYFNENLLVYDKIYPNERLEKNLDKYIIKANKNNKEISLIFKVDTKDNINNIIQTLNKTSTKATFYITSKYLENNYNQIINLINQDHIIGNLSNEGDYNDSNFIWMKTILTNTKQKHNYCLTEAKDEDILKMCALQKSYTIMTKSITQLPYINTKNNLENGKIFLLDVNKETEKNLENIINYIKAKGYQIKTLENLLKE